MEEKTHVRGRKLGDGESQILGGWRESESKDGGCRDISKEGIREFQKGANLPPLLNNLCSANQ